MKKLLRSLLPLLLLSLLASCSVYENIVHPRRLPTPDMGPQAKAKYKAAQKARHKGQVLKSEEPVTGATDPKDAPGSEAKKDGKLSYNELPEGTKIKYDKEGLIRNKPNLKRRQYHRYDTRPLTPNDVNRENRRLRKHPKGKDKGDQDTRAPKERLEAPADDRPAPAADEPKPVKAKEPKEKKSKKVPIPKPDPTVEQGN